MTSPADDYEATVSLSGPRGEIELFMFSEFIEQRADRLLADVGRALLAWMSADPESQLRRHCPLSVVNLVYPRLRPARVPLSVMPRWSG